MITGRLRLGMIGSAGQAAPAVERALAAFHRRHPGVEIAISDTGSRQMAEQVRSGELDLAFVGLFADQLPADLVHRLLVDEPLVVAVPRAAGTAGVPADLATLAARGAFVEMRVRSGLRQQVDAAFARAGVTRRIAFELYTSDAVVRYVALGFGPAVVPRSAAAARPDDVVGLELADPAARHPIGLVHRHPEPSAPSARAFLALTDRSDQLLVAMQHDGSDGTAPARRGESWEHMDARTTGSTAAEATPLVGLTAAEAEARRRRRRGEHGGDRRARAATRRSCGPTSSPSTTRSCSSSAPRCWRWAATATR